MGRTGGLTRGRVLGAVAIGGLSFAAALRAGHLATLPFFVASAVVPVLWGARLLSALRSGVISSRIRTGSRTTSAIRFSFSEADLWRRSATPVRYWLVFAFEALLFAALSALLLVPLAGALVEGGPKG